MSAHMEEEGKVNNEANGDHKNDDYSNQQKFVFQYPMPNWPHNLSSMIKRTVHMMNLLNKKQ